MQTFTGILSIFENYAKKNQQDRTSKKIFDSCKEIWPDERKFNLTCWSQQNEKCFKNKSEIN